MTEQMTTQPAVAAQGSSAKWYIAIIVTIVVSAGAGLVAGMQIGKTNSTDAQAQGAMSGVSGRMSEMRGGFGTVTAVSDSSITIESRMGRMRQGDNTQGGAITYKITGDTKVTNNGESAAIGDLKTGDTVRVETSDDSSDTATAIELNPQMRGGPGTGAQGANESDEPSGSGQNG